MTVKAHCPKCGKEHEMADKYAGFIERNNGEVECPDCKFGKSAPNKDKGDYKKKSVEAVEVKAITPEMYHKRYEEFKAEFGEEFKNIELYVGQWITTTLLDDKKKR